MTFERRSDWEIDRTLSENQLTPIKQSPMKASQNNRKYYKSQISFKKHMLNKYSDHEVRLCAYHFI